MDHLELSGPAHPSELGKTWYREVRIRKKLVNTEVHEYTGSSRMQKRLLTASRGSRQRVEAPSSEQKFITQYIFPLLASFLPKLFGADFPSSEWSRPHPLTLRR